MRPFPLETAMFRSRWGYHPCDYTTYRKLKFLNQVYLRAVRLARAWARWTRKDPHNRVMRRRIRNEKGQTIGYGPPVPLPEPGLCASFSRNVSERRHVDKRGAVCREGFVEERVVTDGHGIAADYASARRPVADPAAVQPLRHSPAELDELCERARRWLEGQDVR